MAVLPSRAQLEILKQLERGKQIIEYDRDEYKPPYHEIGFAGLSRDPADGRAVNVLKKQGWIEVVGRDHLRHVSFWAITDIGSAVIDHKDSQ